MDKGLLARQKLFEQQLAAAEEDGEADVLEVWHSFIVWLEQHKSQPSIEKSYAVTLQKCLGYFAEMPQYNGDRKLMDIYLKSAKMCQEPSMVYKHMLSERIGTQFALLYTTFADHLVGCGQLEEALRTVEQGISSRAQPLRVLQKHLEGLKKVKPSQSAASKLSAAQLARIGDNLERNEEFYQPLPGTELFYPRRLVYPQEEVGVELSLEQLRASLPQYRRAESPSLKEEEGDSMEMTVAYTSHITMHVPLSKMSATGRVKEEEEEEEEEEGAPLGDGVLPPAVSIADKENIMDSENSPPKKESTGVVSKSKRAPLSLITDPTDELEKLNSEKRAVMAARVDVPSRLPALEGDALMQREMEQLALEKPSRKALAELSHGGVGVGGGEGFTPGTVDGGLNWPVRGTKDQKNAFVTKLSFSEADSLSRSTSRLDSTTDGRSAAATHSGFFSATLDCEKRARLTEEQEAIERQFANSPECEDGSCAGASMASWKGQSLSNCQSFEVFHDSWAMNQSKNTSQQPKQELPSLRASDSLGVDKTTESNKQQKNLSAFEPFEPRDSFRPCGVVKPTRKPLGEIAISKPLLMVERNLGSSENESCSFQPSQSNASSFSVFEDTREHSSFVPFHDSWAAHSRNHVAGGEVNPGGKPIPSTVASLSKEEEEEEAPADGRVYYAPVGVPFKPPHDDQLNTTEQTQFDIPHPSGTTGPASTPMRHHITLLPLDISMVPQTDTQHQQQQKQHGIMHQQPAPKPPVIPPPPTAHSNPPQPPTHPPPPPPPPAQSSSNNAYSRSYLCYPSALTVITEESRSFKSSSNSTGESTSATSHMISSTSAPLYSGPVEVNPFLPQNINLMLNTLIDATPSVVEVKGQLPSVVCGRGLLLGNGDEFEVVKKIAEGGFAKIYTARHSGEIKALKIQKPPLQWEMTVLHELHKRLDPGAMSQNFLQFDKAYLYSDASILVTTFFPCGSLLDLVNVCRQGKLCKMEENFLLYLCREMISTVAALHQTGILHTDIKPDNFMIRDIRGVSSLAAAKGAGLCLIDYGRAVDTRAFHEDTMFIGSCETEDFQCVQMLERKPWKWQADYFGIAATCHVLMFGEYMKITKDPKSGIYNHSSRIHRYCDVAFWSKLFQQLINAEETLPLVDHVHLFDGRLRALNDALFLKQAKIYIDKLLKK